MNGTGTGWIDKKSTSVDHPNYNIFKIGKNNEKSSEELRRLALTQTAMKSHQLALLGKILKKVK